MALVANFQKLCEPGRLSGQGLRIAPYADHKGYQCYLDGWKVNGKRKRLGPHLPIETGSCARRRVRTAIERPRHNDTRILESCSENRQNYCNRSKKPCFSSFGRIFNHGTARFTAIAVFRVVLATLWVD